MYFSYVKETKFVVIQTIIAVVYKQVDILNRRVVEVEDSLRSSYFNWK